MTNHSLIWIKPLVFTVLAAPFCYLLFVAATNRLGPDPAEAIANETGEWALRFLLLTLAATPLSRTFKLTWPARARRMIGLFAFFYAVLHVFSYIWLYAGFEFASVLDDLQKRPYIVAGFVALLLMLPLAITSTRAMQRRLGRNWKRLHRAVYFTAVAALVHLFWQSRSDLGEALLYAAFFVVLMLLRVDFLRRRLQVTSSKVKARQGKEKTVAPATPDSAVN